MNGVWLIAFVVQWIVLILMGILLAGVLRYLNSIQERIAERTPQVTRLDKGERLNEFSLPDLHEQVFNSSQVIGGDTSVMLLVVTATCGSCEVLVRQVAELARRPGGLRATGWTVVMAWLAEPRAVRERTHELPEAADLFVVVDEKGVLARDLLVRSLPVGVALTNDGRMLDQSANPGPNWLYLTMGVAAPEHDLASNDVMARINFVG